MFHCWYVWINCWVVYSTNGHWATLTLGTSCRRRASVVFQQGKLSCECRKIKISHPVHAKEATSSQGAKNLQFDVEPTREYVRTIPTQTLTDFVRCWWVISVNCWRRHGPTAGKKRRQTHSTISKRVRTRLSFFLFPFSPGRSHYRVFNN